MTAEWIVLFFCFIVLNVLLTFSQVGFSLVSRRRRILFLGEGKKKKGGWMDLRHYTYFIKERTICQVL